MQFEVDLIRALQAHANTALTVINEVFSFFGTETLFLLIAVVLYWCVDKKYAFRFFNVYILGVAVTNVMKQSFKRARPFNAYDDVRSLSKKETTYSFPSGHTESIASISTMLTVKYGKKHKAVPIIFTMLTLLVMVSRMYLGQHYLSDVFCGLTAGIFLSIAFNALLSLFKDKEEWFIVPGLVIAAVIIGTLAGLGKLDESADILKGLGAFVAFDIGYFIEKRFVKYDVRENGKKSRYVLRVLFGGIVTIGIQYTFKLFLPQSIPMLYCFLRYFVMAIWAALFAPMIFKAAKI